MRKIATLGPAGTFSEMATVQYVAKQPWAAQIAFFPSIKHALRDIGQGSDLGILPIENFSEGFISLVLDELIELELVIIDEVLLPVSFSCIANSDDMANINTLYVQFVAKGQCIEFIESLGDVKIITTESNIESLNRVVDGEPNAAAIVPLKSFNPDQFQYCRNTVNDYENNQTRFLVLAPCQHDKTIVSHSKTSIIVLDDDDHPGLLGEVLLSFSKRQINLTSIMSRPTRKAFGKYHFFIDFDGHQQQESVAQALQEIRKNNKVKILGSYQKGQLDHL